MEKLTPLEPGKYYHIYNRGNNRENIFFEERNYHYFMQLYAKYIEPVALNSHDIVYGFLLTTSFTV